MPIDFVRPLDRIERLALLAIADSHELLTVKMIAAKIELSRGYTSQAIRKLELRGYIWRRPDSKFIITKAGLQYFEGEFSSINDQIKDLLTLANQRLNRINNVKTMYGKYWRDR